MKKHWYEVHLAKEKTIRIFAEDSEEAQTKAEAKLNKRNALWMVNAVYRVDGQGNDDWVAQ